MQDRDAMLIKNFEAFQKLLPSLLLTDRDRIALIRDERLVKIFDTPGELFAYAEAHFKDDNYSIQVIEPSPLDLDSLSVTVSTIAEA